MHRRTAYILMASMMSLLVIGIVMLQSTGAFARDSHGDMYFFVKRQGMWMVVGFVALVVAALVDHRWWAKLWPAVYVLAVVLLILCFIPPVGMKINGAWRWINLGFASFQPSELGKVAVLMFLAWWDHRYEEESREFWRGFVFPMMGAGLVMALIAAEVDLGTATLLGMTTLAVMFVAGAALRWIAGLFALGFTLLVVAVFSIQERMGRLIAFMDPEKYRLEEGLQQWQALLAFGAGGVEGVGLGEGRQKMLYLPYAHTDFIFPMIGEELGLRFTLLTVLCFLLIMLSGVLIAMNARDRFGMLLGFGITILLTLQACINIGVTTSMLPNKGMPLPFISYGGSNLAVSMLFIGILLNIHRLGRRVPAVRARPAIPSTNLALRL
jgi:cell division protein FtsW